MPANDAEQRTLIAVKQLVQQLVSPPAADLAELLSLFSRKTLAQGEYLIRAGQSSTDLAFINSGLLRLFYQTANGKDYNKSFSTEGQFTAAYSAYLTQTPARFSIQALEDSQLLVCDLDRLTQLYEKHSCWQRLGRLLTEQVYIKKEAREAEFLLDDAETRYRRFQQDYPGLEQRIAQYHIASYLGITPVALSRIRRR